MIMQIQFLQISITSCQIQQKQASRVGLKSYLSVTINNAQNTTLGRWVGATPDGRKAGTPMANANNPHPGTDRRGLTPMINSILKPRHDNHAGMVSNLRFTRENFTSARNKMHSLIENYFERGGARNDYRYWQGRSEERLGTP